MAVLVKSPCTRSIDSLSTMSTVIVNQGVVDSMMCVKVLQSLKRCVGKSASSDSAFEIHTSAVST